MVERIEIEPFVFIFLKITGYGLKWMLSINGCGSCGSALSKDLAIDNILKSSRLSKSQREFLENIQIKQSGEQLELF